MKQKRLFLMSVLLFTGFFAFSQNATYLYVDSTDGLRVRDKASLDGKRIGGLTHRQKVKVAEKGEKATIDGIASNWIKIELPSTEWTSNKPEYGWVFGGYLKAERSEPTSVNCESLYTPSEKKYKPHKA